MSKIDAKYVVVGSDVVLPVVGGGCVWVVDIFSFGWTTNNSESWLFVLSRVCNTLWLWLFASGSLLLGGGFGVKPWTSTESLILAQDERWRRA